jgi:glutaminyl-tRNA synthetase
VSVPFFEVGVVAHVAAYSRVCVCVSSLSRRSFCEMIGISRNENFISLALLEYACRQSLEPLARRAMVVSNPIRVVISNYPAGKTETLQAPNFPKDESKGTHGITMSRVVYIDGSDFSETDQGKDFYGLTPGKEVHLKYAFNIRADSIVYEADGKTIKEVLATADFSNKTKCKGKITWVAEPSNGVQPLSVELRLYENLFLSKDPMQFGGDEWLKDLNPNSLSVVQAYADESLRGAKAGEYYQFERVAFFMCDADSTAEKLVFNRTVLLKESKAPAAGAAAATVTSPAAATAGKSDAKATAAAKKK